MVNLALMDDRYQVLDQLPDALYSAVITLAHGELIERVSGILQWRCALLEGELPRHEELSWPDERVKMTLLKRLESLNIVHYCRQQEELTDQVLIDICEGVATADEYFKLKPDGFVDKLSQQQNKCDRESDFKDDDKLTQSEQSEQSEQAEQSAP